MNRKGFIGLVIVVVLALLIMAGGTWYLVSKKQPASTPRATSDSAGQQIVVSSTLVSSSVAANLNNYFYGTSTWKTFASTIGHFSADFPVYPDHATTPITVAGLKMNLETYGSEDSNGTSYVVNFVSYPTQVDTSKPDNNLEGSVNGSVQTTGGTLISSKLSTFLNEPSVDYLIRVPDSSDPTGFAYIKGRNILVDHDLYQIIAEYEGKHTADQQFDKLINSFKFLATQ